MESQVVIGLIVSACIALYGFLAFGAGKIAEQNGRSFAGWFIVSLILSPFSIIIVLLLLGESTPKAVRESARRQQVVKVRCSECGTAVKETASYCPDCGRELRVADA